VGAGRSIVDGAEAWVLDVSQGRLDVPRIAEGLCAFATV
jgi:hypothetical protein